MKEVLTVITLILVCALIFGYTSRAYVSPLDRLRAIVDYFNENPVPEGIWDVPGWLYGVFNSIFGVIVQDNAPPESEVPA